MIRAAGYCRVSTTREDQVNSFEAQQRFFREYINRQENWILHEIYADEGISGTSTRRRVQFHRMLTDARDGKFQLILTKEVSRFSRNILDTIRYTRELKRMGIGVLFLNDNICTLEPDAELRLSIMASIAQEESRRTSERVKWGQMRQMECGVVFGHSLLGYTVLDGKIHVEPEGAEIVRQIFHKYGVEKKGTTAIAQELCEAGCNNTQWSNSYILKILKNEKYAGDLIQKKTITPDYLTHEKKRNCGEEEMIVLRDHHEAIIPRELWETVQEELKRRKKQTDSAAKSVQHVFSGKIRCGECGAGFVSRLKYRKDGSFYRRWRCGSAGKCTVGHLLRDDTAEEMVMTALRSLHTDRERLLANVTSLTLEAVRGNTADCELSDTIRKELTGLLNGEISGEYMIRTLVDHITVFKDRHCELTLNGLSAVFYFKESGRKENPSAET